jgi:sucrase/ferredoxin-like protein
MLAQPDLAQRTWECSHIGGDRFAANLLCFPHGIYYGWVEPAEGSILARAYADGRVDPRRYRGRAGLPVAVQAAEQFLRQERGLTGVDDLRPRRARRQRDGSVEVIFDDPGGTGLAATVGVIRDGPAVRLTCKSDSPAVPPRFARFGSG